MGTGEEGRKAEGDRSICWRRKKRKGRKNKNRFIGREKKVKRFKRKDWRIVQVGLGKERKENRQKKKKKIYPNQKIPLKQ